MSLAFCLDVLLSRYCRAVNPAIVLEADLFFDR